MQVPISLFHRAFFNSIMDKTPTHALFTQHCIRYLLFYIIQSPVRFGSKWIIIKEITIFKRNEASKNWQVRFPLSLRESRRLALLCFWPRDYKGVRGQRHAPAAPYRRERPGTHCTGGWVGLRAGLDWCGKSRLHRDLIPGPSSP